eukprot:CAMPEP_0201961944 /NCGR_PEP_ID=MMETSP0904-20121228/8254_1 /ASSEMBLY_ACC=CAM_ASM_000553 /TAXON_ID=420261 /ORGANISM="Thalassiosira antarctica, Strain CCMP982" /LENGTH=438 /DNA_ID=CAMNT_0048508229 /DNA_START=156 /DNA_END=1472 /DNA_ORIENTATION=+
MTMAILLIATSCIMQNPSMHEVHAYSPSIGMSRRHHCRSLSLRHTSMLPKFHWSKNVNFQSNTHLFSTAGSDDIQGEINETIVREGSFNENTNTNPKTDDLLPSTMASFTNSRMGKRRANYGPSSSVLLPLSESIPSQQTTPLFQPNSNVLSEYNPPEKATSWKERLVDVSNIASLLCVLDCTLLPLVSIAIPALSWGVGLVTGSGALSSATTAAAATGTGSNSIMVALSSLLAYLPALSHGIALYFVIPVGLLTTTVNYFFGHKEVRFSLLSLVGVALIYAANSSTGVGIPSVDAMLHSWGIAAAGSHVHGAHVHDACGAVVGAATGMMAHTCPEGLAHRMTNTLGCAFLLGSNYYSKKYMEEKNQGCAASALAEAWGGESGGRAVCPPGCNCEAPSYGTSSSASRAGGDTFFQWESKSGNESRGKSGGRAITRFRR